jgi:DNA polymerase
VPNVDFDGTLAGWRAAARALLAAGVAPDHAAWRSAADAQGALALGAPAAAPAPPAGGGRPAAGVGAARVPRRFLALAALVACHRDAERWGALYRVLWRLTLGGEPRLLAVSVDADVLRLTRMAKAVRRDVHKMHAFVRFRSAPPGPAADGVANPADPEYVAWFEPEHDVVAQAAPFFARRFPNMRWAILTPRGTARWDGEALAFGPGVPAREGPRDDSLEALWGVYYAHIFNPARLKLAAMRAEMPKRYWRNLPEARLIDGMVRDAPARVRRMVAAARPPADPADARAAPGPASVARPRDPAGDVRAGDVPAGDAPPRPADAAGPGAPPLRVAGAEVRVGVAGWAEPPADLGPAWYPEAARTPAARLRHLAARLALAEADASAAFPTPAVAALWASATPAGFAFDVRAHALVAGHAVEPRRLPRRLRDLLPPSLSGANRVAPDEVPARLREAAWADLLAALAPLAAAGKLGAVVLRPPRDLAPSRAAAAWLAGRARRWAAGRRPSSCGTPTGSRRGSPGARWRCSSGWAWPTPSWRRRGRRRRPRSRTRRWPWCACARRPAGRATSRPWFAPWRRSPNARPPCTCSSAPVPPTRTRGRPSRSPTASPPADARAAARCGGPVRQAAAAAVRASAVTAARSASSSRASSRSGGPPSRTRNAAGVARTPSASPSAWCADTRARTASDPASARRRAASRPKPAAAAASTASTVAGPSGAGASSSASCTAQNAPCAAAASAAAACAAACGKAPAGAKWRHSTRASPSSARARSAGHPRRQCRHS